MVENDPLPDVWAVRLHIVLVGFVPIIAVIGLVFSRNLLTEQVSALSSIASVAIGYMAGVRQGVRQNGK